MGNRAEAKRYTAYNLENSSDNMYRISVILMVVWTCITLYSCLDGQGIFDGTYSEPSGPGELLAFTLALVIDMFLWGIPLIILGLVAIFTRPREQRSDTHSEPTPHSRKATSSPHFRRATSSSSDREKQAPAKDIGSWKNIDDLRSQDMKMLGALQHPKYHHPEFKLKGMRRAAIDLPLDKRYRERLMKMLDASEREAFQQAYARLEIPNFQDENQRQQPDPEQVVEEARPLFGDPISPSGSVGSELQSAELGEHGAVDEKGEDIRQRLKLLKDYFEEGLITEDDYATRKAAILGDL